MASVDEAAIRESLSPDVVARMERLDVFGEIGSTNSYLLQQDAPAPGRHHIVLRSRTTRPAGEGGRDGNGCPRRAAVYACRSPIRLPAGPRICPA